MNLVENGGKLGVLGVLDVDGGHGVVKVLDVLGVHLEEGRVAHHDVPDLLELGPTLPAPHPLLQLQQQQKKSPKMLICLNFPLIQHKQGRIGTCIKSCVADPNSKDPFHFAASPIRNIFHGSGSKIFPRLRIQI